MEQETKQFYEHAIQQSTDAGIRQLLGDLAEEERVHAQLADTLETAQRAAGSEDEEAEARKKLFLLQIVQPGLAGLMDGSVSTLAPLFAAAFATRDTWSAFRIGLAAALGAGISMGFAEAMSDDGSLTGRGKPLLRGLACGLMTAVGGLGPRAAVSDSPFLDRHGRGDGRRVRRTGGNLLDSQPLHGHAAHLGPVSSHARRHDRVCNGDRDRVRRERTRSTPRARVSIVEHSRFDNFRRGAALSPVQSRANKGSEATRVDANSAPLVANAESMVQRPFTLKGFCPLAQGCSPKAGYPGMS